jgi:hypothetical protein
MSEKKRRKKRNFVSTKEETFLLGTMVTEPEKLLIEAHCKEKHITKSFFVRNSIAQTYPNLIQPIV